MTRDGSCVYAEVHGCAGPTRLYPGGRYCVAHQPADPPTPPFESTAAGLRNALDLREADRTGRFSRVTVAAIRGRDDGRCIGCGRARGLTTQHRIARGMGGTGRGGDLPRVIASPINGITLCGSGTAGCHGWAERHRTAAARLGWSVSRVASATAEVARELLESTPVLGIYLGRADWWRLTEDTFSMAHDGPFDLRAITSRDHPAADTVRQLTTA